jgi:hypothetical protein
MLNQRLRELREAEIFCLRDRGGFQLTAQAKACSPRCSR